MMTQQIWIENVSPSFAGNPVLDQLKSVSDRFGLGLQWIQQSEMSFSQAVESDVGCLLLGAQESAAPKISALAQSRKSALAMMAPFSLPQAKKASVLLWPFEDTVKSHTFDRSHWMESQTLSRSGVEMATRLALRLAKERACPSFWLSGSWGGAETYACELALDLVSRSGSGPLPILDLEQVPASLLLPHVGAHAVLLGLSRTCVPLARILGSQGWIAICERGPMIAQAWGANGPKLVTAQILDHLGFVSQSEQFLMEEAHV